MSRGTRGCGRGRRACERGRGSSESVGLVECMWMHIHGNTVSISHIEKARLTPAAFTSEKTRGPHRG